MYLAVKPFMLLAEVANKSILYRRCLMGFVLATFLKGLACILN
jgi:hypothetical protein